MPAEWHLNEFFERIGKFIEKTEKCYEDQNDHAKEKRFSFLIA
jgi:hypothetical protein